MANGKVVQVIGTVVDVEFAAEDLPEIYNGLELQLDGGTLSLEVEQHVGNNWVRCLALGPTEGLKRGSEVTDTGIPIAVPVGPAVRRVEWVGSICTHAGGAGHEHKQKGCNHTSILRVIHFFSLPICPIFPHPVRGSRCEQLRTANPGKMDGCLGRACKSVRQPQ